MAQVKPEYHKIIHLGMVPARIVVVQGIDIDDAATFAKTKYNLIRTNDEKLGGGTQKGCAVFCEKGDTLIWLKYKPTSPLGISVLAHEALHAIGYAIDHAGIPYKLENDEILTYGMDYIVYYVLEDFKGHRIGKDPIS